MNILIVDDEYYIVKNISENLPWKDLGIDQVFTAYSADQAKKVLDGDAPVDLMLADIEMPRENGLSLISWAHEHNYYPVTMFLTGHQRFDYAQAAINLHIFSYLLKPVDLEELKGQLIKAIAYADNQKQLKGLQENPVRVSSDPITHSQAAAGDSSDPVSRIKSFIRQHLSDSDLDRQMIADSVHMNLDYMSHIFSTRTGTSLSSYIMDMRIGEAKRLLVSTNLNLSEISERTGFSNTSYFHRQFKKSCGMTPQSYRDMNKH